MIIVCVVFIDVCHVEKGKRCQLGDVVQILIAIGWARRHVGVMKVRNLTNGLNRFRSSDVHRKFGIFC